MEAWEIEARLGVADTIARYARHADAGRSDELAALFADDGVLATGDAELVGPASIGKYLDRVREDLAGSTSGGGRIRHHVSSLRVDVDDRDHASATSYFLAVTAAGVDHWGTYRDRLVRIDGVWRFAERRAVVEGHTGGGWAADRRN